MIAVSSDADDQRLDRWLRRLFPYLKQGQIEKMCRKGALRVDGGRVKANTRIYAGQTVRVPPLAAVTPASEQSAPQISDQDREMLRASVIYRDEHLIAINKPAGLAVQGGSLSLIHI